MILRDLVVPLFLFPRSGDFIKLKLNGVNGS